MDAVVFDLFGTLVAAPVPGERTRAAAFLATAAGCDGSQVEQYLRDSWQVRHDGRLPTLRRLAEHLLADVGGPAEAVGPLERRFQLLAQERLAADPSVPRALAATRKAGPRLGVLSDAGADVADVWPSSSLAGHVDAAVFSCTAGALKPSRRLYDRICSELDADPARTLYLGDGGGDELRGAVAAGMSALAVRRRGPVDAMVFGAAEWSGPMLLRVEDLPAHLDLPAPADVPP